MSAKNKIYVTEFDMKRLKGLIKFAEEFWDHSVLPALRELDKELDRAEIFKPQDIPRDVITMNSTFRLRDLNVGEEAVYTLVFPGNADSAKEKISILSPMGTAVLGSRIGDTVVWNVSGELKRSTVQEILYQPEASWNLLS